MRKIDKSFLKRMPIAHRGYHNADIPENSIPAAANAIAHGYAIELDIHALKDGNIVVFHDEYALRTLGLEKRIGEYTYDEIKDIDYMGIEGLHVPLFTDYLKFIDGRVPLLIELKPCFGMKHFVEDVVEILKNYHGEYVVQSFSPFVLMKLKKLAPEIIRGQLVTKDLSEMPRDNLVDMINYLIVWVFGFTSLTWFTNPDFFNIDIRCFGKYQKRYAVRNVLTFVVRNEEEYDRAMRCTDNVVFEGFEIELDEHGQLVEENRFFNEETTMDEEEENL